MQAKPPAHPAALSWPTRWPHPFEPAFPADVKRDAQIPLLRPDFLHGHDAGEAGVVVAALGVLVDVTGLDDRSMNGE